MNPVVHTEKLEIDLSRFNIIFWDFDGVIKDSFGVKTLAFEKLFLPYGQEISQRVKSHHEANGGISRFKKIPLYLSWAGEDVTVDLIDKFCNRFSEYVFKAVINSPWVPGIREYLFNSHQNKYFVLVTATPQAEIEGILSALEIDQCFREIYGSPVEKQKAIRSVLDKQKVSPDVALMIGDTKTDLLAARANLISFLLRKTPVNQSLQNRYDGPQFDDLAHG